MCGRRDIPGLTIRIPARDRVTMIEQYDGRGWWLQHPFGLPQCRVGDVADLMLRLGDDVPSVTPKPSADFVHWWWIV